MIRKIIRFSAENRYLVLFATAIACLGGLWALDRIAIDAIPDLSDTQVIVYSQWDRSPDLVEDQLTYPIVSGLLGAPQVKTVRGVSDYGFSYVYVIFEDGTDLYWARSRVLEYLNQIRPRLPEGASVELGPDATSVGWIYQYALINRSGNLNISDLRSFQDWSLKFQLQSVEGVSEVATIGGFEKQFQIHVDPIKLQNFKVSLQHVIEAIRNSNQESGGRVIEFSGAEAMIRSEGLVEDLEDLENAVVAYNPKAQSSVLIKHVARVQMGPSQRRGIAELNGEGEVVGGIVVMRQGEDTVRVIDRVKKRIEELKAGFPKGVELVEVYDRSHLIRQAIETLQKSLTMELIIVSLVILFFLWHIPSAIVPIVTIPVAILLAFIPLYLMGFTANIMSLAGIAISIGVLVDGAIVEVENAYKKIQEWQAGGKKESFFKVRLDALLEVGPSVFFSLLVIAVSFLPIFTLVDQEGRLFKPLAWSKNLTMFVAAILAITLDPALRMLFARSEPFRTRFSLLNKFGNSFVVGTYYSEEKHPISRRLHQMYQPVVGYFLKRPFFTFAVAGLAMLSTIPAHQFLGKEFMPPLREGSLLYMPTALPGMSVPEASRLLQKQDEILKGFDEVESVFGKAGRANTSTDVAPLSMVETTVVLKPQREWQEKERWHSFLPDFLQPIFRPIWPDRISEEELISKMNKKLQFAGMPNIWTMPIRNRIDMLSTGIRTAIGVKVSGEDIESIEKVAVQIEEAIKKLPEARSVVAERTAGAFFLDIDFDRQALQRLGMSLMEAQDQAMTAIGGKDVSTYLSGRERYPIQVRFAKDYRNDPEAIHKLLIQSSSGAQVPLSQIAKVKISQGPGMLRNENGMLTSYVFVDLDQTADVGGFVERAKKLVSEEIVLPEKTFIAWSGQFENMQRVKDRLQVVLPITLILIIILLFLNTGSWVKTSIVLLSVPFSLVGAFWFLWILDYNVSIATWVGMIALMGLSAETGIFMLMYLDLAVNDRKSKGQMTSVSDLYSAVIEGSVNRIRPKTMTVMTAFLGLLPIMWSTGLGADVAKRVAAPMIGGLFTSFLLILLVYPVIYYEWKKREYKMGGTRLLSRPD